MPKPRKRGVSARVLLGLYAAKLEIIMKTPLAISDTVDPDVFRHSSLVIRHF
jgi:hypothetical protein